MLEGFSREQKIIGGVALGWIALLAVESLLRHRPEAAVDKHLQGTPRAATLAALSVESDPRTLRQLSGYLGSAGYPKAQAATATRARQIEGRL